MSINRIDKDDEDKIVGGIINLAKDSHGWDKYYVHDDESGETVFNSHSYDKALEYAENHNFDTKLVCYPKRNNED